MNRIFLLLALALAATPAGAQARYLPQPDTLYYEALNPYRMYFLVPGGDTVGDRVRSRNVGGTSGGSRMQGSSRRGVWTT